MPKITPDAEESLRKLGERLRHGWATKHPASPASLQTMKDAVREQWEKERQTVQEETRSPDEPQEPSPDQSAQQREGEEPER